MKNNFIDLAIKKNYYFFFFKKEKKKKKEEKAAPDEQGNVAMCTWHSIC